MEKSYVLSVRQGVANPHYYVLLADLNNHPLAMLFNLGPRLPAVLTR